MTETVNVLATFLNFIAFCSSNKQKQMLNILIYLNPIKHIGLFVFNTKIIS